LALVFYTKAEFCLLKWLEVHAYVSTGQIHIYDTNIIYFAEGGNDIFEYLHEVQGISSLRAYDKRK
jgi:hypothetical protein